MRGNGRIFQRGRVWWIAYCHRGKEYRESSRSEKRADARRLLKKRLGEIHSDRFVGPSEERVTVSQLLDELVADYTINGRKNLRGLKCAVKHLRDAFGLLRAVDVTESMIERYKRERLNEEPAPAPATINRELSALRRAFNLGRKRRLLSKVPDFQLLRERNARQGFVDRADFNKVTENLPNDLRDFAEFAFLTAWRRGEIASLVWGDIEFDPSNSPIAIRLRAENSKNERPRMVPLEGELRGLIERRLTRRAVRMRKGELRVSPFVFHRGDCKPVGDFRKRWEAATIAAGLPELLFHDLRRSGVRNMVRAGVPERIAMEISGHRTRSVFDRYNIVSEDDLRTAITRTQGYLASQCAEEDSQVGDGA